MERVFSYVLFADSGLSQYDFNSSISFDCFYYSIYLLFDSTLNPYSAFKKHEMPF
jgi:hypothetical protein